MCHPRSYVCVSPDRYRPTAVVRLSQMFGHLVCKAAFLGFVANSCQTASILRSTTSHSARILLLGERREGMFFIRIHDIWHMISEYDKSVSH